MYQQRQKSRRIIQNTTLIELLIVLSSIAPMPVTAGFMWLVFKAYPTAMIPACLIVWATLATYYLIGKTYVWVEDRKYISVMSKE